MAQIFHRSMNSLARFTVFGLPLLFMGGAISGAMVYRSGYLTGRGEIIDQPVPFSHKHHVSELGIDCRFCHTAVETSSFAGIPPTKTCMNCHNMIWTGAETLKPVRDIYATDKSIPWERVHNLPDYAYFNHSIHLAKGVGCVSCHGQIDQMALTFQSKSLLMEWCLDCHKNPEKNLRPKSEVFSMKWKVEDETIDPDTGKPFPKNQKELGKMLKEKYKVRDSVTLTSCSMCHR